jgi:hypothetical protein
MAATDGGTDHWVTFQASILGGEAPVAHEMTARLSELDGRMTYCTSCEKKFVIFPEIFTQAIDARSPSARGPARIVLEPVGYYRNPELWKRRFGHSAGSI